MEFAWTGVGPDCATGGSAGAGAVADLPAQANIARAASDANADGAVTQEELAARIRTFRDQFELVLGNVGHVIKGKEEVVRKVLIALTARAIGIISPTPR